MHYEEETGLAPVNLQSKGWRKNVQGHGLSCVGFAEQNRSQNLIWDRQIGDDRSKFAFQATSCLNLAANPRYAEAKLAAIPS